MGPSKRPRDSTRARKAHPPKKPRHKPVPPLSKPHRARAVTAGREGCVVPAGTLRGMKTCLDRICSVAIVVAHALSEQNALLDADSADVLRWYVSDPLHEQVLLIERLIKGGAS